MQYKIIAYSRSGSRNLKITDLWEFYPLISKEKKHWVKNLFSALIVTISKCVTLFILLTKTEDSRLFKAPGCSEIKCTQLSSR